MTITTQQVTSFHLTLDVLVEEGFGFSDKLAQINHLGRCVAVIEIKCAARLQCHTTRTSQAFTTSQFLGVNNRAAFENTWFFPSTPFAVGFQSVAPAT